MRPERVIAGNWKMHHGPSATRAFFRTFRLPRPNAPRVLVFPPALSLQAASECLDRDPAVGLGVQNIYFEPAGAFTGEISANLAAQAGATHTLVGHSERRHLFGETDGDVARKVRAAIRGGLIPVICVGETLEQRREGRVESVILGQLDAALEALGQAAAAGQGADFLLAYEPVWAIGTGETATPDDAAGAHGALRGRLGEVYGVERAVEIPILYGGSVKPGNAAELLEAADVDGLLVGGASLDPESFADIVTAAL